MIYYGDSQRSDFIPSQKKDVTWNVKIRVTHKRQSAYIDTQHFVSAKQLMRRI